MEYLRPATEADAEYLAPLLRKDDVLEVYAASGREPLEVLLDGIRQSAVSYTLLSPAGLPFAVGGVVQSPDPDTGFIWMLGTDELPRQRFHLARHTPRVLRQLHSKWRVLTNLVDARNACHIDWLKRLGFQLHETVNAGHLGLPFIRFTREHHV